VGNITISVPENLLEKAKEEARKQKLSLNAFMNALLERELDRRPSPWAEERWQLLDQIQPTAE
jgi:hypothetical protein